MLIILSYAHVSNKLLYKSPSSSLSWYRDACLERQVSVSEAEENTRRKMILFLEASKRFFDTRGEKAFEVMTGFCNIVSESEPNM